MPFSLKELIKNNKLESLEKEIQANVLELQKRADLLQKLCIEAGCPVKVWIATSGLRTKEDHIRIYKEKAAKEGKKFDITKVPMGSQHLTGGALDISDPGLVITKFLKARPEIIKEVDLYFEEGNTNWLHMQLNPPRSGKRWFLP